MVKEIKGLLVALMSPSQPSSSPPPHLFPHQAQIARSRAARGRGGGRGQTRFLLVRTTSLRGRCPWPTSHVLVWLHPFSAFICLSASLTHLLYIVSGCMICLCQPDWLGAWMSPWMSTCLHLSFPFPSFTILFYLSLSPLLPLLSHIFLLSIYTTFLLTLFPFIFILLPPFQPLPWPSNLTSPRLLYLPFSSLSFLTFHRQLWSLHVWIEPGKNSIQRHLSIVVWMVVAMVNSYKTVYFYCANYSTRGEGKV